MKHVFTILTLILIWTSCYKVDEEVTPYIEDKDTAEFTIKGAGFNDTVRTKFAFQAIFADPSIGENYASSIIINNEKSPEIDIYLENFSMGTYNIDGFKNRAFLYTTSFLGDAISGKVIITEQTGSTHFAGIFNLTFRNNSINPTDTIIVIGSYIADN